MTSSRAIVYLVFWPNERIVKVGYTTNARWREFVRRGARIYALTQFATITEAADYETQVCDFLDIAAIPAFKHRAEAAPYLGKNGNGWSECYHANGPLADVLAAVPITRPRQESLPV